MLREQLLLQEFIADHNRLAKLLLNKDRCICELCKEVRSLYWYPKISNDEVELEIAVDLSSHKNGKSPPDNMYDYAGRVTTTAERDYQRNYYQNVTRPKRDAMRNKK